MASCSMFSWYQLISTFSSLKEITKPFSYKWKLPSGQPIPEWPKNSGIYLPIKWNEYEMLLYCVLYCKIALHCTATVHWVSSWMLLIDVPFRMVSPFTIYSNRNLCQSFKMWLPGPIFILHAFWILDLDTWASLFCMIVPDGECVCGVWCLYGV